MVRLLASAAIGYAAGTMPSADMASRLAARAARAGGGPAEATDLRTVGSGNPGAANAMAVLGRRWGYSVLAADMAKGAAAAALGRRVGGDAGAHVAGTAAVVGHCFPVWSRFRGGKGVAAGVGQCAMTFPASLPVDLAVVLATSTLPLKRRAHAATVAASASWVAGAVLWWRRGWPNLWGPQPSAALPLAAATSSAVILGRFAAARRPLPRAGASPAPTLSGREPRPTAPRAS